MAVPARLLSPRDLASEELWARSLERSRRRREAAAARRPALAQASTTKVSLALAAAALLAPGTQLASAARSAPAAHSSSMLRAGSSGDSVTVLQRTLKIAETGTFDDATAAAVRAFQRERGLEVDGIVGPQTAAALGLQPAATRKPASLRIASPALRLDRTTTKALQRAVGVRADGVVGARTRAAIKRAERRHDLRVDGRPDAELLAALGVAERETDAAPDARQQDGGEAPAPAGQGAGAAVAFARAAIGTPYGSAGNGPESYDCSGLTVAAFKAAGVTLPRTSFDQYAQGTRVAKSEIQAGDLVFFDTNGPGASHVGVATSATAVISATTRGVREHPIGSGYWAEHFVGARRPA